MPKWVYVLEVLAINAVLIALFVWVSGNYAERLAYWGTESPPFKPNMVRYPLFFITSAVRGSTNIPGLLSIDWQQVVAVILIVTDALFARSMVRDGGRTGQTPI